MRFIEVKRMSAFTFLKGGDSTAMLHCSVCNGLLQVREMVCPACELHLSGDFSFPRMMRLSAKNLALGEALILAGGNLKELALSLGVSYPTVRKRVDDLIDELKALRAADERKIDDILRGIEAGTVPAAKGTRMIKELNGTG
jgi:hypothetical protein